MDNFDVVSVKILEWVNANDSKTLYHVTRLIVEKAVKNHGQTNVCVHLCKEMVKRVSGKTIRDTITKNSKSTVIAGGPLFREHLGEVCQKELEDVTVSVTAALARSSKTSLDSLPGATRQPEVRRLHLIRFIRQLSDLTSKSGVSEVLISRAIVEKWIATLLDAKDAEKLVTLSMLLDSAGPRWDASTGKLKTRMNICFVEMTEIAQTTDNARLRTLLQDVIERRDKGWVVNETTQQERNLLHWFLQAKSH
ncbi:Armadillo-type fold [Amanita muscaria]